MSSSGGVLLSSAGRRVGLLRIFRRALAEVGCDGRVVACDVSATAPALHMLDAGVQVPGCDEPAFVNAVLDAALTHQVVLVVPTIDTELAVYAESRRRFGEVGILSVISGPETVAIAADKRSTHLFLTEHGLPTVQTASAESVLDDPRGWSFPLIVKPPRGSAGLGVAVVSDVEELRFLTGRRELLAQPIAAGDEYTVDVFMDGRGQCRGTVARRRIEVRAGEVSKGVVADCPMVLETARAVCSALPGAFGVLTVQIFHDRGSGSTAVIEINPRFGGGYPLADAAGAPFARWLVQLALGIEPDWESWSIRDRLAMLRYDEAVYVDADSAGIA